MAARLLDGASVAAALNASVLPDVQRFAAAAGRPPGLGIVLVGEDPASEIYVRGKARAGGESGVQVDLVRLPATATLDELLGTVDRLNRSSEHDGILVQSPLPPAMGRDAAQRVFDAVDPAKDVDGFHPVNVGWLSQGATASRAVHSGRSNGDAERAESRLAASRAVVSAAATSSASQRCCCSANATVTVCHSKTPDLAAVTAVPIFWSPPSAGPGS